MFENLSSRLDQAIKSLSGQGRITELNVARSMGEIRRALLDADVNYQVARTFANRISEQAVGERVLKSVKPGQFIVKIVYEELVRLLGGQAADLKFASRPPTVILVAGLQGSGKTTFCAKLAHHLKNQGRVPMLAAADVYRPAAVDQLKKLAHEVEVPVYSIVSDDGTVVQDAPRVAAEAVVGARKAARDVVIIDTAGRLHVDEAMMSEVAQIKRQVKPSEILFVVDSMTGQDAVKTAKEFNRQLNFDGVVLTKLDGDTRGGAALSIRSVVNKPIKFASTGEKITQLTAFYPDRMARRILGMGDVLTLVEKAQEQVDATQMRQLRRKIRRDEFDLQDLYDQLQKVRAMGSMRDMLGMVPGMSKLSAGIEESEEEEATRHVEALILSMTPHERRYPHTINSSRRRRIARGSGLQVVDVNQLLRDFKKMRKLLKRFSRASGKGHRMDLASMRQAAR
ncbi:MAG: signal recognition particle protein [Bacteroidota bacterium]|nr:signal recognition particle protein [Bacteroidota bacterium]MDE2834917.1 signal recognition particle protein [Bacteroidota bacterium]